MISYFEAPLILSCYQLCVVECMHSSKFTLWSDPRNAELLERVRDKDISDISVDDARDVISTQYRCDFCGNLRNAISCGFVNLYNPDIFFREEEMLVCPGCVIPEFSRILLRPDDKNLFLIRNTITYHMFSVYNKRRDYYIPVSPIYVFCDGKVVHSASLSIFTRHYDPFYQIDRTLFQLLSQKIKL